LTVCSVEAVRADSVEVGRACVAVGTKSVGEAIAIVAVGTIGSVGDATTVAVFVGISTVEVGIAVGRA
jgi:hypothetical protein